MREYKELYVGGRWVDPATERRIDVVSPHSEQPVGSTPEATEQDVDRAVTAARQAFDAGPWPRMEPAERLAAVRAFAAAYAARQEEFAELITTEMGAPLWFSYVGQVGATMTAVDSLLAIAEGIEWEERPARFLRRRGAGPARAGRRGRRDHPVERAALRHPRQGRPGPARRLSGGA